MNEAKLKGSKPLKVFPVPKRWFPIIEYALGIKLTPHQKLKLFYPERAYMGGARSGQTLTHCILVALSIGPPLSIERASDFGDGTRSYQQTYFYPKYKLIAESLESVGFDVRQVGNVGGWKL